MGRIRICEREIRGRYMRDTAREMRRANFWQIANHRCNKRFLTFLARDSI